MKVGVTGGTGFIGQYVCEELAARGHTPVVFDHRGEGNGGPWEVMLGDIRDATALTELAAHCDGIIHLAACLGTQETIANPRPAALTNMLGGLNFLEAVSQYGIAGCYIGVGNHWMQNTYSISKTTVERFVHMFNAERGTKVNIVRLVNAYGPGQSMAPPFGPAKVRKITPAFIARALTGAPIEIYGDGEQVSDMVHVRDGAEALVRALEASHAGHLIDHPVEIGPTRSATVNEVAEEVVVAAMRNGLVQGRHLGKIPIRHLPMRPGETPGAVVSADWVTMRELGMDPDKLTDLRAGMNETVLWYAENWLPEYEQKIKNDVQRAEQAGS